MQDYYFAPKEELIIELGRDQWVFNPRENSQLNNAFNFYTWEEDNSPDNHDFDTMEDFYNSFNYNKPFTLKNLIDAMNYKGYIVVPICKNNEDKYAIGIDNVVGLMFQKPNILVSKGVKNKNCKNKVLQELLHYNQYKSGEVFFMNTYMETEAVSYKNCIYDKNEELAFYEDNYFLGCYENVQECLEDHPELYGEADSTGVRNIRKKNNTFIYR
jgi:hypothetical protein